MTTTVHDKKLNQKQEQIRNNDCARATTEEGSAGYDSSHMTRKSVYHFAIDRQKGKEEGTVRCYASRGVCVCGGAPVGGGGEASVLLKDKPPVRIIVHLHSTHFGR